MYDVAVIGGGAAGFFAALRAKSLRPELKVAIFEKSGALLSKVRISGGGRCNVTHHQFDPVLLSKNYPRGSKELLGLFHRFGPLDTIAWFKERGVELKTEKDGRMFPITDSSETIINALVGEAKELGVEIRLKEKITTLPEAKTLILASGSSPDGYEIARSYGHTIVPTVPSLFTFNIPTSPLKELSGIAIQDVKVTIDGFSMSQRGPLLITHFGFSGPAVLKLSAWAARFLHEKGYLADVHIDWLSSIKAYPILLNYKKEHPKKVMSTDNPFQFPKNFWKLFSMDKPWKDVSDKDLLILAEKLHNDVYKMEGKTTHKEEFVTAGGVMLKEVDFRTMQSKIAPHLFFAGEILDIDGVTGGFNFQNAWSTGYTAGQSAASLC
ncbi:MAG: NAD(P)/FAD-dependent oxidoreductase [Chlamydiae bacterium]|nr:NAD(P)/FAD-dependent oxidoreductase [Chlamydiota bacterium]